MLQKNNKKLITIHHLTSFHNNYYCIFILHVLLVTAQPIASRIVSLANRSTQLNLHSYVLTLRVAITWPSSAHHYKWWDVISWFPSNATKSLFIVIVVTLPCELSSSSKWISWQFLSSIYYNQNFTSKFIHVHHSKKRLTVNLIQFFMLAVIMNSMLLHRLHPTLNWLSESTVFNFSFREFERLESWIKLYLLPSQIELWVTYGCQNISCRGIYLHTLSTSGWSKLCCYLIYKKELIYWCQCPSMYGSVAVEILSFTAFGVKRLIC